MVEVIKLTECCPTLQQCEKQMQVQSSRIKADTYLLQFHTFNTLDIDDFQNGMTTIKANINQLKIDHKNLNLPLPMQLSLQTLSIYKSRKIPY